METAFHVPRKQKRHDEVETEQRELHEETSETDPPAPGLFSLERLNQAISRARDHLLSLQNSKGYWVFDLEADCTIPAEYVFLHRFFQKPLAPELADGLVNYLRRRQLPDGGWPLFRDGAADVSATVKAYFALKLLGDAAETPHMIKARRIILSLGGASKVNVFTRISLALFGQIPWRTVPAMLLEIMLLPKWFFFNIYRVSYWSRTVIVPLLILISKRPVCSLSREEGVEELFLEPPHKLAHLDHFASENPAKNLFILLDRMLKQMDRFAPRVIRKRALARAERWIIERMQGEGGLGAIFPAMANAVMALKILGYPEDHPDFIRGMKALEDLLVRHEDEVFCQPCVSPIWDSCLSLSALLEEGLPPDHKSINTAVDWLLEKQVLAPGDWSEKVPRLEPGGWAFQFENSFYPDVDDTPAVLMAILRAGGLTKERCKGRITKGVNWLLGMQSSDGGWGAFDVDNNSLYLNAIPFADHGALLDPSTSDLTGRCTELFSMLGFGRDFPPLARAFEFLRREQTPCGAWLGRWGVNYLYGTWSVLVSLRQAGEDMTQPYIRKAVQWLKSCQNSDQGWGETCNSYRDYSLAGRGASTASQTAWALLALMAAGEHNSPAVQRGIHYLIVNQDSKGGWEEEHFTGTGFPNVFFLRYHGYSHYFPLWALAVYRRLRAGKKLRQDEARSK